MKSERLRHMIPALSLVVLICGAAGRVGADTPPPSPGGTSQSPRESGTSKVPERLLKAEAGPMDEGEIDPPFAFDTLRKLAGEWEGRREEDGSPVRVAYRAVSGGTAVTEAQFAGTDSEMISVYFVDGKDLVLTHYSPLGNQPRLRFSPAKSFFSRYLFEFAGGSGVDKTRSDHVHEIALEFPGKDQIKIHMTYYAGRTRDRETTLVLSRAGAGKADASPPPSGP